MFSNHTYVQRELHKTLLDLNKIKEQFLKQTAFKHRIIVVLIYKDAKDATPCSFFNYWVEIQAPFVTRCLNTPSTFQLYGPV